jgi:hypothetical protein
MFSFCSKMSMSHYEGTIFYLSVYPNFAPLEKDATRTPLICVAAAREREGGQIAARGENK